MSQFAVFAAFTVLSVLCFKYEDKDIYFQGKTAWAAEGVFLCFVYAITWLYQLSGQNHNPFQEVL